MNAFVNPPRTPPHITRFKNRYNITAQPAPDLSRLLPSFRPEELGAYCVM